MKTINRSFKLKKYYGVKAFYTNVKNIIKQNAYNTKTFAGAVNIMYELGTINDNHREG